MTIMRQRSTSLAECTAKGHKPSRLSNNGVDVILECPECCRAWLIQGITGDEIRLYGSYERRLIEQKIATGLVAVLSAALPAWHFNPYGPNGAVACYPPDHPSLARWDELSAVARIQAVCGPLYVVSSLHGTPSRPELTPRRHALV